MEGNREQDGADIADAGRYGQVAVEGEMNQLQLSKDSEGSSRGVHAVAVEGRGGASVC